MRRLIFALNLVGVMSCRGHVNSSETSAIARVALQMSAIPALSCPEGEPVSFMLAPLPTTLTNAEISDALGGGNFFQRRPDINANARLDACLSSQNTIDLRRVVFKDGTTQWFDLDPTSTQTGLEQAAFAQDASNLTVSVSLDEMELGSTRMQYDAVFVLKGAVTASGAHFVAVRVGGKEFLRPDGFFETGSILVGQLQVGDPFAGSVCAGTERTLRCFFTAGTATVTGEFCGGGGAGGGTAIYRTVKVTLKDSSTAVPAPSRNIEHSFTRADLGTKLEVDTTHHNVADSLLVKLGFADYKFVGANRMAADTSERMTFEISYGNGTSASGDTSSNHFALCRQ